MFWDLYIKKNDLRLKPKRMNKCFFAIGCKLNFAASRFEHTADEFSDIWIIIDNQSTYRGHRGNFKRVEYFRREKGKMPGR